MKRTNYVTRLISGILFVGLALYFGVYMFRAYTNPLSTTTAVYTTAQDYFVTRGIIVRDEMTVSLRRDMFSPTASEGEKVSGGQTVAVAYDSGEDLQEDMEIREMEREIELLQKYLQRMGSQAGDMALDEDIYTNILEMNYNIAKSGPLSIDNTLLALRALVFSGDISGVQSRLESLREEHSRCSGANASRVTDVTAEVSGVFSTTLDGFESVTPETLAEMGKDELLALLDEERNTGDVAAYKLVTGIRWYFAAVVSPDDMAALREATDSGQAVSVAIDSVGTDSCKMEMWRIDDNGEAGGVVVFACGTSLTDTLQTRKSEAEVICNTYSGIYVPAKAVYRDEAGNAYVYTLTGVQAERKYITILYKTDGGYLAQANTEPDKDSILREGNEIIVSGKDLYDGKVVS